MNAFISNKRPSIVLGHTSSCFLIRLNLRKLLIFIIFVRYWIILRCISLSSRYLFTTIEVLLSFDCVLRLLISPGRSYEAFGFRLLFFLAVFVCDRLSVVVKHVVHVPKEIERVGILMFVFSFHQVMQNLGRLFSFQFFFVWLLMWWFLRKLKHILIIDNHKQ